VIVGHLTNLTDVMKKAETVDHRVATNNKKISQLPHKHAKEFNLFSESGGDVQRDPQTS
jgi:hypothetical protein